MKLKIFLWALYDFANTPLTVAITGLYLAQWIVLDNKVADIWYSTTFTFATILLLVTSPFLGAWSDRIGKRMPFITWTTLLMMLFGAVLGIIAPSSLPTTTKVTIALLLFFILQYLYQTSLIFYSALLSEISTEKNRGKISGIGTAIGQLGWLVGPAMLLPFATGAITLFGTPGRSQVFLPSVILFAIFGLPMIFWFRESRKSKQVKSITSQKLLSETIIGIKKLIRKEKNVALYLLSFMLISDALLTGILFFGIFLDQIYQISDTEKVIVLAISQVATVISALMTAKISDKQGIKKILFSSCIVLIVSLTLIALFSSSFLLYFFAILLGVGMGGFYPTARAFMINISPKERIGEYFGFYSTFEKFSSIIGPLIWGFTTLLLAEQGVLKYRIALLLLIGLMIIGTLLLLKVNEQIKRS